jgi:type IV fimbrial biogenesis protein FimT
MTLTPPRHRHRGFTFVELMITVMVAAILMTLAVPQFRSVIASTRLTTQSNDLVAALNFARSTAIKRNGSVSLCRTSSATDTACATSQAEWAHWIVRTSAGNVLRRGSINTHGGTLKVSSELNNDTVVFGADGLARTAGALLSTASDSLACSSSTDNCIKICTTTVSLNNWRHVILGAGSRITTNTTAGTCS